LFRGMGLSFGYNRAEGEHQYLSGAGTNCHLADVVSRGRCLLLNVGSKADGTIPCERRECLEGLGCGTTCTGRSSWACSQFGRVSARAVRRGFGFGLGRGLGVTPGAW